MLSDLAQMILTEYGKVHRIPVNTSNTRTKLSSTVFRPLDDETAAKVFDVERV
jgi:hypothetical protein